MYPTNRYEQEDETLSEGCRDKVEKYNTIRTELCAITGATDFVMDCAWGQGAVGRHRMIGSVRTWI